MRIWNNDIIDLSKGWKECWLGLQKHRDQDPSSHLDSKVLFRRILIFEGLLIWCSVCSQQRSLLFDKDHEWLLFSGLDPTLDVLPSQQEIRYLRDRSCAASLDFNLAFIRRIGWVLPEQYEVCGWCPHWRHLLRWEGQQKGYHCLSRICSLESHGVCRHLSRRPWWLWGLGEGSVKAVLDWWQCGFQLRIECSLGLWIQMWFPRHAAYGCLQVEAGGWTWHVLHYHCSHCELQGEVKEWERIEDRRQPIRRPSHWVDWVLGGEHPVCHHHNAIWILHCNQKAVWGKERHLVESGILKPEQNCALPVRTASQWTHHWLLWQTQICLIWIRQSGLWA